MHIVVIPSWYKSAKNPFTGSFFEEQARALQAEGNKVSVFFPSFYPSREILHKKPEHRMHWDDNGLMTHATVIQGIIPKSRRINNRYICWQADRIFKKYMESYGKPDILHAHSVYDAGIIGLHLSRKYNIPMVLTEHLTHFKGSLKRNNFKKEIAKNVVLGATQSIAVSNKFKEDLEHALRLGPNVFKVVHNMVANHFYDTFIKKTYDEQESFIFFTNSFMNERKNHELQFDALKLLISKNINVKLVVGGNGERQDDLLAYVIQNGLQDHVTFKGGLTRQEVKQEIDNSHAFLLSSKFESFGVVLIESIISGRPVISTDCGGPCEIINPENGYLVPSSKPEDYAAVMEKMMHNYSFFNQAKMRAACADKFSEHTISCQLMDIYEKAIIKQGLEVAPAKFSLRENAATIGAWLFFLE